MVADVSGYSERAHELAEELAERAAENLRRSGKTVVRNPATGRYIVTRTSPSNPESHIRRVA
ncbi:hypothetical protein B7R21_15265 [Subtercola boreus]|uniref:Guanylate cyclase domain-containing protein n=1 Tax=Subtercola boreus TaxID=120213 RepID=A0A3E0VDK3_9MICO|nr:hypothetical protein B7R21_15265 [Subtercola boreus]